MLGEGLSVLLYVMIIAMFVMMIYEMLSPLFGINLFKKREYLSRDAGERLKRYLIRAGQTNPKNIKAISLKRTGFNEGGGIGRVVSIIPSKFCTRFIFKTNRLGRKRILYCPIDMHSSLHTREVMIYGLGLEDVSGFYYPIPYKVADKKPVFDMFQKAFNIDMASMQLLDMHQIHPTQIEKAIAGEREAYRRVREAPEDLEKENFDEASA